MENEQADAGRDCRNRLARSNSQARTNGDREIFIFPAQLTTSRVGNLTRSIPSLAICVTIQIHIHHITEFNFCSALTFVSVLVYLHGDYVVSVCMVTHIAIVWINRVRLPILLVVS